MGESGHDQPTEVVEVGGCALRFVMTDHGQFWEKLRDATWEPETIRLFGRLPAGARVVDVGAWIGALTLLAAAKGASVVAFEPDPEALKLLRANIALNPDIAGRVTVRPVALGWADGPVELGAPRLGDSISSMVARRPRGRGTSASVPSIDAASWGSSVAFAAADFVKVDVEGAEFRILHRLRRALSSQRRPAMLISVHAYVFVDGAVRWPSFARVHVARARSARRRARLLADTRSFGYRWTLPIDATSWTELSGVRRTLRFVLSLAETDLFVADSDELIM